MILLDSKGKQGAGTDGAEAPSGKSEEKASAPAEEEAPAEEDQDPLEEDLPF